jgi:hypothetical protein
MNRGAKGRMQDILGKTGYKPLRRRCRWVYNNKMVPGETGWDGMGWNDLAEERVIWEACE